MKHKHAKLIKAWADGAEIEVYQPAFGRWEKAEPAWHTSFEYRIKPEPKPDYHSFLALISREHDIWRQYGYIADDSNFEQIVKVTHDGETHKLKSAEVLK